MEDQEGISRVIDIQAEKRRREEEEEEEEEEEQQQQQQLSSEDEIRDAFEKIDSNGDGMVEVRELRDAMLHLLAADEDQFDSLVSRCFQDLNGVPTEDHLLGSQQPVGYSQFRHFYLAQVRVLRDVYEDIDHNGDGRLEVEEILCAVK
ncbi:MAG: EF-hand domain-containing protein, partial [archaeon]|nr:EF-hand domain-containing protein [archaeon]